jgi:NAD(P)-dependent dehydrogenase (short-subunit alcohol dehydrogenase family)
MSKVWIVTGAARGLGRSIAGAVLAAGDRLVAGRAIPRGLPIWRNVTATACERSSST